MYLGWILPGNKGEKASVRSQHVDVGRLHYANTRRTYILQSQMKTITDHVQGKLLGDEKYGPQFDIRIVEMSDCACKQEIPQS